MDLCLSAREHVVRCHVANRAVQSHVGEMEKSQPHFSLDAILWSEAEKNLKVQDHRAVRPHAGILAPRFTKAANADLTLEYGPECMIFLCRMLWKVPVALSRSVKPHSKRNLA